MLLRLPKIALYHVQVLQLADLEQTTLLRCLDLKMLRVVVVEEVAEGCALFIDGLVCIFKLEVSLGFELAAAIGLAVAVDITEGHPVVTLSGLSRRLEVAASPFVHELEVLGESKTQILFDVRPLVHRMQLIRVALQVFRCRVVLRGQR